MVKADSLIGVAHFLLDLVFAFEREGNVTLCVTENGHTNAQGAILV
jgi:hypothetical protein